MMLYSRFCYIYYYIFACNLISLSYFMSHVLFLEMMILYHSFVWLLLLIE